MTFDGETLTVSTGAVSRAWLWTGRGLATVEVKELASGRAWAGRSTSAADWKLDAPLELSGPARLAELSARVSDDEGFTDRHLEIVATVEYPEAASTARYVIWAYPRAPGLRTQLLVRTDKSSPHRHKPGPEVALDNREGVADTLPISLGGLELRWIGFFSDTQNRNRHETPILRESRDPAASASGANDWASILTARQGEDVLILVKESHKCVNTPEGGANTGGFHWTPNEVEVTGIGWRPEEFDGSRFRAAWATWVVLAQGGEDEVQLALKRFDRARFPIDPDRDLYVLANTWGSSSDRWWEAQMAAREENVLREIESQKDLGIDVQQIDSGWHGQALGGWRPVPRVRFAKDSEAHRVTGLDGYSCYPEGWSNVRRAAVDSGMRLGLWFTAKASAEDWIWNYEAGDFRYYKIDFADLRTMSQVDQLIAKVRRFVLHTGHGVRVNWDVTEREPRVGYFFAREYGQVFLANRKTRLPRHVVYKPYLVLRDAWHLAHYVNLDQFQIAVQNVDLVDPELSDAHRHRHDYCLAQTLMASPIFFQLTQKLEEPGRQQIRRLLTVYKRHRLEMSRGHVFPIGNEPDNATWSGFQNHFPEGSSGYLTLFRQINSGEASQRIRLRFLAGKTLELEDLLSGRTRTVEVAGDGTLEFSIERPGDLLFLRYEGSTSS